MQHLGLFPLGIVLFPESAITMHIFEERYKNLIIDSLENNHDFGINLSITSVIQKIGCTASVIEVLKHYSDGNMDIVVKGGKRFNLVNYKVGKRLYYEGDVEFFEDSDAYPDGNLVEKCIKIYNEIAEQIKSLKMDKVDLNKFFTRQPSFYFAQKSGLTNEQKYRLLETKSENLRLRYLLEHLKKIEPMLKENEYINMITKNDGYTKTF
jgi:ATP-dependent Lon protease